MHFSAGNAKKLLEQFEFDELFIEELGWDRHNAGLSVAISGTAFALKAVAEKRGMVVWLHQAPAGQKIPDRATRKKIGAQVAKTTLEHLLIFTDTNRAEQIWCWARREAGKPASVPEHFWYASSGNRGFLQKLQAIAFSLAEEDSLTLVDVTSRARAAFDVERVTKRFYDQFKVEHNAFLDFISGITDLGDREWYASLMLNRLMFIYFMQRKGFLDGERDYLQDRLARCRRDKGHDRFYSFYRYFLLRLFHEGLGGSARNPELDQLLGRIPYLNGGLFELHPIEERCPDIRIPDEAFTRIFAYFDRYQWHLDERPLRNDNEINPDIIATGLMCQRCLDILLRGKQPVVMALARGIGTLRLPSVQRKALDDGRLTIMSPFSTTARRVGADLARRRNRFAAALAEEIVFGFVTPGGSLSRLREELHSWGIPYETLHSDA